MLVCAEMVVHILAPDEVCKLPSCDDPVARRVTGVEINWASDLCEEHRDWVLLLVKEGDVCDMGRFKEEVYGRGTDV